MPVARRRAKKRVHLASIRATNSTVSSSRARHSREHAPGQVGRRLPAWTVRPLVPPHRADAPGTYQAPLRQQPFFQRVSTIGYSGYSSSYNNYGSYSSPSYSSGSSGGGSGGSARPRWSRAGSSVIYTPAEVRALTPVRESIEKPVPVPDLRDVFLCHAWDVRFVMLR